MTNTECTIAKSPWTIGPWSIGPIASDGSVPVWVTKGGDGLYIETREDLESLRDALTAYLAPDGPTAPVHTHLAVLSIKTAGRATGWAKLPVALSGAPSQDTIAAMEHIACAEYGTSSATLVNLIPLGDA